MYLDALLCHAVPRATRWTVAMGVDDPAWIVPSARFRWRRNAEEWTRWCKADLARKGITIVCKYAVVPFGASGA